MSFVNVSPALYRHTYILLLVLIPHPSSTVPFHTMAVKCPVAAPLCPDSHPGSEVQSLNSLYHPSTAASSEPYPIARFSPAGPAGGARLYELECCIVLRLFAQDCAEAATSLDHTTSGTPCMQRYLLCAASQRSASEPVAGVEGVDGVDGAEGVEGVDGAVGDVFGHALQDRGHAACHKRAKLTSCTVRQAEGYGGGLQLLLHSVDGKNLHAVVLLRPRRAWLKCVCAIWCGSGR